MRENGWQVLTDIDNGLTIVSIDKAGRIGRKYFARAAVYAPCKNGDSDFLVPRPPSLPPPLKSQMKMVLFGSVQSTHMCFFFSPQPSRPSLSETKIQMRDYGQCSLSLDSK